jgi:hypothetical protein
MSLNQRDVSLFLKLKQQLKRERQQLIDQALRLIEEIQYQELKAFKSQDPVHIGRLMFDPNPQEPDGTFVI